MASQEQLFPTDRIPIRRPGYGIPLLEAIGIDPENFDHGQRYARINPKEGSKHYIYGKGLTSVFTDRYEDEIDNTIEWSVSEDPGREFEGFIVCAVKASNGEDILHLLQDITDHVMSLAFRLEDIETVSLYSENAAMVKGMHQNEWGNSIISNEELGVYTEKYWPEPEIVYDVSEQTQ